MVFTQSINLPDNSRYWRQSFLCRSIAGQKDRNGIKIAQIHICDLRWTVQGNQCKRCLRSYRGSSPELLPVKLIAAFIISSHIVEAADALRKKPSIDFLFLANTHEWTYAGIYLYTGSGGYRWSSRHDHYPQRRYFGYFKKWKETGFGGLLNKLIKLIKDGFQNR